MAPSRGVSGRGVKLTTHPQLVPRSRIRGSLYPLPVGLHGVVKHRDNFTFSLILSWFEFSLPTHLWICLNSFSCSTSSQVNICHTDRDGGKCIRACTYSLHQILMLSDQGERGQRKIIDDTKCLGRDRCRREVSFKMVLI
jgi:hypothetical protein